jgi:hypothetical protein
MPTWYKPRQRTTLSRAQISHCASQRARVVHTDVGGNLQGTCGEYDVYDQHRDEIGYLRAYRIMMPAYQVSGARFRNIPKPHTHGISICNPPLAPLGLAGPCKYERGAKDYDISPTILRPSCACVPAHTNLIFDRLA